MPELPPPTDDLVARAEMQRKVLAAALALDEPYRSTVLGRYFDGRSCSALAKEAGIPASTMRNRLHKALAILRGQLATSRQAWVALLALAGMASAAPGATTALAAKETTSMITTKLALTMGAVALTGVIVVSTGAPTEPQPAPQRVAVVDNLADDEFEVEPGVFETEEDESFDEGGAPKPEAPAGLAPLEKRVAELEKRAGTTAPNHGRGPALSGPKQIAEALSLTEAQVEQMTAIYDRQRKQYNDLLETPNADGVTPNEYFKPLQQKYREAFDQKDFAAVHEAMTAMGKAWEWKLPGSNETYGEASQRQLREANAEFEKILTKKQRSLYADKAYMGSFAVPLDTTGGK